MKNWIKSIKLYFATEAAAWYHTRVTNKRKEDKINDAIVRILLMINVYREHSASGMDIIASINNIIDWILHRVSLFDLDVFS